MKMGDVGANRGLYGSIKSAIEAINTSTDSAAAGDSIARPSLKMPSLAKQQAGSRPAVKVLKPLTERFGDGGARARNGPSSDESLQAEIDRTFRPILPAAIASRQAPANGDAGLTEESPGAYVVLTTSDRAAAEANPDEADLGLARRTDPWRGGVLGSARHPPGGGH